MAINQQIVISAGGITAVGVVTALSQGKGITRIVLGGYLLAVFLSVADLFGGAVSSIAGAIAMVALVAVILADAGPLFTQANNAITTNQKIKPPSSGGSQNPTTGPGRGPTGIGNQ